MRLTRLRYHVQYSTVTFLINFSKSFEKSRSRFSLVSTEETSMPNYNDGPKSEI